MAKSVTHADRKKLNGDSTKLEAFFTQLNLKLQRNMDYFTREEQKTE